MSEVEILGLAGVGILAMFLMVRAFITGNRSDEAGDHVSASGTGADSDGDGESGGDEAHSATSRAA